MTRDIESSCVLVHVELGAGQALGLAEEGHGQAATKPLVQAATDVVVDATQHLTKT